MRDVVNAMSVDVEDYFHVAAFEDTIPRADWEHLPCRVERNVERVLALFDEHGVESTFFTLGWVAERYPQLVRRIVDSGHELASHGQAHVRVHRQDRATFREDVSASKKLLEDVGGVAVKGYRAASYSIGAKTLWALDELKEAGYLYSSSIYPIRHDLYGMPEAPRFPFRHREDGILEIPISTRRLMRYNWPNGGGGYFRLLPYRVFRKGVRHINQREGKPCVFFFHPWEVDIEQPRQRNVRFKSRFRHYLNLGRMEARLRRLCSDFRWARMDHVFLGTGNGNGNGAVL